MQHKNKQRKLTNSARATHLNLARKLPPGHPDRVAALQNLRGDVFYDNVAEMIEKWKPIPEDKLNRVVALLLTARQEQQHDD